jgi:hypothetical protein
MHCIVQCCALFNFDSCSPLMFFFSFCLVPSCSVFPLLPSSVRSGEQRHADAVGVLPGHHHRQHDAAEHCAVQRIGARIVAQLHARAAVLLVDHQWLVGMQRYGALFHTNSRNTNTKGRDMMAGVLGGFHTATHFCLFSSCILLTFFFLFSFCCFLHFLVFLVFQCGGTNSGTQTRTRSCINGNTGAAVAESYCTATAPALSQPCTPTYHCYSWSIGTWSSCPGQSTIGFLFFFFFFLHAF